MISVQPKAKGYDVWSDGRRLHVVKLLVFSGSYPTGGDTLSLNLESIKSSTVPFFCNVDGISLTKYDYAFLPGPTMATCKLRITDTTTGLELAAGPYPNALMSDTVTLYAITLPMQ